jgi:sterol desaturase/sphingolipid hydroxylase (fatty acid hydroxylase superfamily)
MDHKLISVMIIAGTAMIAWTIERVYPYQPGQRPFRRHFLIDWLWYSIALSYIMGLLCFAIIIPALGALTTAGTRWSGFVTDWPLWAQLGFFLLTHELWIYWFQRWMHANKYLWRIHEPHHTAREVDWAAGSRSHLIESVITTTVEFGPIVLLGASPLAAIYKGVMDASWGMFIHANIDIRIPRLQYVINGPQLHRWHHARDVHDINFATKFAFWDWIFGTAYFPADKPARYGTELDWPRNLLTQQLLAFRPLSAADGSNASEAAGPDAISASRNEHSHSGPKDQTL